jgi:hypothetical protein
MDYLARYEQINAPYVYRVRPNDGRERYETVEQLWYPKDPNVIKKFGRANYPKRPVFYCSDSPNTALIEQKINEPGDSYTVLTCERMNRIEHPFVFEIGVNDITGQFNPRLGGNRPHPRVAVAGFLNDDYEFRKYTLFQDFLINQFTKVIDSEDDHLYKITAVITEQVLNKIGVDGICFPSVQSVFKGVNVAFTTQAVDRLYRPIQCHVVKVTEIIDDPGYRIEPVSESEPIGRDGRIAWKNDRRASLFN